MGLCDQNTSAGKKERETSQGSALNSEMALTLQTQELFLQTTLPLAANNNNVLIFMYKFPFIIAANLADLLGRQPLYFSGG